MENVCALVVDDDGPIRALLTAAFRRHGISTEEADDGEVALERLRAGTYRVILLDLMMPKVSGLDVLAYMSKHGIATPVIVMSAASQQLLDTVKQQFAYEVVRKPFDVSDLMAKVVAICERSD